MKWSWHLGRFAGIDVKVHATFVLLLGWVAWSQYARTGTLAGSVFGVGFVILVFATVVLHEYGHALTARRFGVRTRDITLFPIGGVARLERMPDKPLQELAVALAGPAVNLVLAATLLFVLLVRGDPIDFRDADLAGGGTLVEKLFWVNVVLAVFNMLPAFPMDGGRVLRALLAMRGDYAQATARAAAIGQGLALLLGTLGLFGNPFLVFIAFFIWIGAAAESATTQTRAALEGLPVESGMISKFDVLQASASLQQAVDVLLAGSQADFPVVDADGRMIGVLTSNALVAALAHPERHPTVGAAMTPTFVEARPGDKLVDVLHRLQSSGSHLVPVVQDGQILGLVTMANVAELLTVQRARAVASVHA